MRFSPDSPVETELGLAADAYRAGDLAGAGARVDSLLQLHGNRADVQMAKAMVTIAGGDRAQGLERLLLSLEIAPNNPEALAWAAHTSLSLNRFLEAEGLARRFVQVLPDNPRAHYLLGEALHRLGSIRDALSSVDRALELKPDDTDSLVLKARLLKSWQLNALAIEFYRKALAVRPVPAAAIDLAQILLKESHPREALEMLQHVAPSLPEGLRPYDLIARAHTEMLQFDEAERYWSLAERFFPDRETVIQTRAKAEIAVGRFEEAEAILVEEIERGRAVARSFFLLTTARKMRGGDLSLIERMEERLCSEQQGSILAAKLHFGLGKSYDDIKLFEKAIGHFDQANRICFEQYSRNRSFDQETARRFTDYQIELFTLEKIPELQVEGLRSSVPLFVVGMARSGTTLTESILSAHSAIRAGGEQAFWTNQMIELFQPVSDTIEFNHGLAVQFGRQYLELIRPPEGTYRYAVDKNPSNFQLSGMLHRLYPNAKFVHLKRHAVDNVLSIWMTPFADEVNYVADRENLVFAYKEHLRLWRHFREVLPSDRFATFLYEELTSNPDATIPLMLRHLELEMEPACLEPEKNERAVLTPSVHQVRQPINRGSQERWRNYEPWLGPFAELLEEPA